MELYFSKPQASIRRYGIAALSVILVIIFRLSIVPLVGYRPPYPLLFVAVVITAALAGRGPGVVTTITCSGFLWFLMAHDGGPDSAFFAISTNMATFLLLGVVVSVVAGQLKDAHFRAAGNEARYRAISETLPHLIWMSSPDGRRVHFNQRMADYCGIPVAEGFGEGWHKYVHPDDAGEVLTRWRNSVAAGIPFRMEFRLLSAEGTYRWFDSHGIPIRDTLGTVVGWTGSNTDIQEARELREALRLEGTRFQKIVDAISGAVCVARFRPGQAIDYVYGSPHLAELTGFTPSEIKTNPSQFTSRIDNHDGGVRNFLEGGIVLPVSSGEFRYHHPVTGKRWIEGRVTTGKDAEGSTWCYVILTDVTARKLTELGALEWQRAFDQADLAMTLHNPEENTIRAVNAAWARQRGYAAEELGGLPFASMTVPGEVETLLDWYAIADSQHGHVVFDSVGLRKDGTTIPVSVDLTSIRDATGKVVSRVALVQDLTERTRILTELERSKSIYRAIAANIPDTAVIVYGPDLRIQAAEGSLQLVTEVPKEIKGAEITEILRHWLLPAEPAYPARALSGESFSTESTVGHRTLLTHWLPLRDEQGNMMAGLFLAHDLTSQRRSERELTEAQRIAGIGSWNWDAKSDTVTGSQEFFRIHHWDPAKPMPRYSEQTRLYDAETWERLQRASAAAISLGIPYELDVEITLADGARRWVTVRAEAVRQSDGVITGLRGTRQDITARKHAETALRESEQQFRTLAHAIPQLCWIADAEGSVIWYNERWFDYTGTRQGASREPDWQLALHPDQRSTSEAKSRQSLATGSPLDLIAPVRAHDGSFRHFLIRIVPLQNLDGSVVRWFGTATDISEQREILDQLQAVSEQRRLALEAAELGSWELRMPGGQVSWDDRCKTLFGAGGTENYTFEDCLKNIDPEHRASMEQGLAHAQAGLNDGFYHQEFRIFWPDGSEHWIASHGRAFREETGGDRFRILGVCGDITERRRAEQALRDSDARFRALIEADLVGIVIADDREIFEANDYFIRLLGYSRQEFTESHFSYFDITAPGSLESSLRAVDLCLRTGSSGLIEKEYLRRDGSVVPAVVGGVSITHQGRRCILGFILDLTERRSLENQLRQVQKLETVGQLAGGIAHDFNNFLTVILGNAGRILENTGPAHPFSEPLDDIVTAAGRAASLTRQLLTFSRLQPVQPSIVPVNEILRELEKMMRHLTGDGISLDFALSTNPVLIRIDPVQLEQVVMNLVVNARDAMEGVGVIAIETSSLVVADEFSGAVLKVPAGNWVQLVVSDSGCGMSPAVQAHIFEPFFTTKDQGKGTGLGLSTVHGIVLQAGGSISVHSAEGLGTTVRMLFPACTGDAELPAGEQPQHVRGGNETILVVEDEPGVRRYVREILTSAGYTVLDASDARAALTLAAENSSAIRFLLSDFILPGSSGFIVARDVRALIPCVPVLLMSGHTERIGRLGNDALPWIQKPFRANDLLARIRSLLDAAAHEPELLENSGIEQSV